MASKRTKSQEAEQPKDLPFQRLRIEGFKCFREPVDVELGGLTVLAGANSSGKSSFLQPLLLMKQTLEVAYDPGPLLLDGPLVRVHEAKGLFWRGKAVKDRALEWTALVAGRGLHIQPHFTLASEGLRLAGNSSPAGRINALSIGTELSREDIALHFPHLLHLGRWHVRRKRFLIEPQMVFDRASAVDPQAVEILRQTMEMAVQAPLAALLDLIHLPGLRGNPLRSYPLARATERFPGAFQDSAAGLLLAWKESDDPRLAQVGQDLRTLGLSWKVEPRKRGDTAVELHLGRLPQPQQGGAQDTVNVADMGLGASQVLPVVTALHAARPGQAVHIEQPELHLHPRAQVAMASLLVDAMERGAQVIVETHSSVLIRALQVLVATRRELDDRVVLLWFQRDGDGASIVRRATLDAQGSFGDWPADFDEVELDVHQALIDATFQAAD